jgi:transposase-like protein
MKAKIVLEALREDKTLAELGARYNVHPNIIGAWKKQAVENMHELFTRPNKKSDEQREAEAKEAELLKIVGEQKVENDFLKKKYRQLYGREPDLSALGRV